MGANVSRFGEFATPNLANRLMCLKMGRFQPLIFLPVVTWTVNPALDPSAAATKVVPSEKVRCPANDRDPRGWRWRYQHRPRSLIAASTAASLGIPGYQAALSKYQGQCPIPACYADMPLSKVARKMREKDIGAVPVGENDRLIGMETDRDICCRGMGNGRDVSKLTARDVMTKPIVYCKADQDVDDAIAIMRKAKVRRLPVIGANKRMVGLLSLGDISAKATRTTSGFALKGLSAHHAR